MYNFSSLLLLLTVFFAGSPVSSETSGGYKDYTGYKVYRVFTKKDQVELLEPFLDDVNYDFWSGLRRQDPSDIMVTPKKQDEFVKFLEAHNITYDVLIPDVQKTIEREREENGG